MLRSNEDITGNFPENIPFGEDLVFLNSKITTHKSWHYFAGYCDMRKKDVFNNSLIHFILLSYL